MSRSLLAFSLLVTIGRPPQGQWPSLSVWCSVWEGEPEAGAPCWWNQRRSELGGGSLLCFMVSAVPSLTWPLAMTPWSPKACDASDKIRSWLGLEKQENLRLAAVLVKEIGVKNGQGREEVNIVYFLKSGETRPTQNPTGHSQQVPCYLQPTLHETQIDDVFLELKNCLELASWGTVSLSECAVWCFLKVSLLARDLDF